MTFINKFRYLGEKYVIFEKYSLYLNEFRKNLAANLDRSSLMRSYGYASADDQSTLFAIFPLNFVPFMQYAG
jgi:hypothetical protein